MTLVLVVLLVVLWGANRLHGGLIDRLQTLDRAGETSEAGKAALANSTTTAVEIVGSPVAIDALLNCGLWTAMGLTYGLLFYITFLHRWRG